MKHIQIQIANTNMQHIQIEITNGIPAGRRRGLWGGWLTRGGRGRRAAQKGGTADQQELAPGNTNTNTNTDTNTNTNTNALLLDVHKYISLFLFEPVANCL